MSFYFILSRTLTSDGTSDLHTTDKAALPPEFLEFCNAYIGPNCVQFCGKVDRHLIEAITGIRVDSLLKPFFGEDDVRRIDRRLQEVGEFLSEDAAAWAKKLSKCLGIIGMRGIGLIVCD